MKRSEPLFKKILIANRGEIANRVIRTCRRLHIKTVAVYSEADISALHVKQADEAILIGPPPATDSYLNLDAVIRAAVKTGADALHPGYGFLAENAHFADVCRSCNIEFIGPSVESMRLVGDKVACKQLAVKHKVPTAPGSKGKIEDERQALSVAHDIGFPVMIKAAAGGALRS